MSSTPQSTAARLIITVGTGEHDEALKLVNECPEPLKLIFALAMLSATQLQEAHGEQWVDVARLAANLTDLATPPAEIPTTPQKDSNIDIADV